MALSCFLVGVQMTFKSSRDAILKVGTKIMYRKGYSHTGISEVLAKSGIPKGSFYHFFRSKEDFGISVMDYYNEIFASFFQFHLDDKGKPPLQRLKGFFEASIDRLERQQFQGGCLIGNIGQEMGDQNPEFSRKAEHIFSLWQEYFLPCLEEARDRGDLPSNTDCEALAAFIWNSWEGALLRMKVTKSDRPLCLFVDYVFGEFLKS